MDELIRQLIVQMLMRSQQRQPEIQGVLPELLSAAGRDPEVVLPALQVPSPREERFEGMYSLFSELAADAPQGFDLLNMGSADSAFVETLSERPEVIEALFHSRRGMFLRPSEGMFSRRNLQRRLDFLGVLDSPREAFEPITDAQTEAWKKYLGLPISNEFIKPATERPSIATNPDTEYFKVEGVWDILQNGTRFEGGDKILLAGEDPRNLGETINLPSTRRRDQRLRSIWNQVSRRGGRVVVQGDFLGIDALADFTLSASEDDKGKFLSYYDIWDLEQPLEGVVGKPFEIYDKIYINEED